MWAGVTVKGRVTARVTDVAMFPEQIVTIFSNIKNHHVLSRSEQIYPPSKGQFSRVVVTYLVPKSKGNDQWANLIHKIKTIYQPVFRKFTMIESGCPGEVLNARLCWLLGICSLYWPTVPRTGMDDSTAPLGQSTATLTTPVQNKSQNLTWISQKSLLKESGKSRIQVWKCQIWI